MSEQKKEIYTYEAPWLIYSMNWSVRADRKFRLAIGSFVEDFSNKIQIVQLNEDSGEFDLKSEFEHPYPPTKLMWAPEKLALQRDLLATTGDYLRLWRVGNDSKVKEECVLNNVMLSL